MVSTSDAHGIARKLERERENLSSAPIADSDRDAIREFGEHREISEGLALSTVTSDIGHLRRLAERSPIPLLEFASVKDVNRALRINANEFGVSPASNDNYRKAMRVFFAWATTDPEFDDFGFWEQVKIPSRATVPVDPDEILSIDEVAQLRQTAEHPRDKALIEFLADTGMRITAALQILRGDVDGLDGPRPTFKANRDGKGQKGIDPLPRPIIQSKQQLRIYLHEYHPGDYPDAPLFATKRHSHRERDDWALHPSTVLNLLKSLADNAGIDRDRVSNHCFRHVAVTRMRRDMNMDWDEIAHRTGWSDRSLASMKQVYGHLSNEDKNDRVWQAVGKATEEDGIEDRPAFIDCVNCHQEIDANARFCPNCGADQEAQGVHSQLLSALAELPEEYAQQLLTAVEAVDGD